MSRDPIPMVDLGAQYRAHRDELDAAVQRCLEGSSFIGGPDHRAFAEEFAAWCGVGGAAALCGNGTDALRLALVELLGPGNGAAEVIVPSHTFFATGEAVVQAGYRPVFADIRPDTMTIDPEAVAAAVTERSRAVIPVHLYGQMADMDAVCAMAEAHELKVIEDAAQAHGASWCGDRPGARGDAACFSFYPGKNLGAWGDGGAVLCRDAELAARIAMRADHGRSEKYLHAFPGDNSRLDGLQAAVLRVKLRHLDSWTEARREAAARYDALLADLPGVERPAVRQETGHVWHLYVVRVAERDAVLARLREAGVGAGVHYPVPLHEQPAFADLGYRPGDLPESRRAAREVLSLPIFPEITAGQQERVADALRAAVAARAA